MKYQELLAKNIKELRLKHNLTQEVFAEKIGLTTNGVSNIERNRYQPTAETIDRICRAFKITPAELLLVPADSNKEIIENIVTLLSECPTKKLKKIYEMVLKKTPELLGIIRRDTRVRDSIRNQSTIINRYPTSEAATDVMNIVGRLLADG